MNSPDDWPQRHDAIQPKPGHVDVWAWRYDDWHDEFTDFLTDGEIQELTTSTIAKVRQCGCASRSGLRLLLGRYLKCQPREIEIVVGELGKPRLASSPSTGLEFNVAHSGDWILAAFATVAVGIDLEVSRDLVDQDALARRVMSHRELGSWQTLTPEKQLEDFFVTWTRKEAVTKLVGDGLQLPMTGIELKRESSGTISARWHDRSCHVYSLDVGDAGNAALATTEAVATISCCRLAKN